MVADWVNNWHDAIAFVLVLAVANMAVLAIVGWRLKR